MNKSIADFLIIGAGVVGLNIAISLKQRYPDAKVIIIEKESETAVHASGRNSGVLHAGFYYTSDSVKAKFCKEGNEYLTNYCLERNLPINQCGKLVVTKNEEELTGLDELLKRGRQNKVELIEIDEQETQEICSEVSTFQKAIYSPSTATVDPRIVMESLVKDAADLKIDLRMNTAFVDKENRKILTSSGDIESGYVINAAGLYADKIALMYGFSKDYRILPFKGLYLYTNQKEFNLTTNVYPVPDLENPFLGVHFTLDVNSKTKIGPTAIPAFWREQYSNFDNFNLSESIEILFREAGLFLSNHFEFRKLAFEEIKKYSKKKMVYEASKMVPTLSYHKLDSWGKPGIRAQLINISKKKLEMDFIYEGDDKSFHILNAVSPAFTCSKPFADFLVEHISELIR
jgi:(S)-2-hydroxyglutarate dehydrogenase